MPDESGYKNRVSRFAISPFPPELCLDNQGRTRLPPIKVSHPSSNVPELNGKIFEPTTRIPRPNNKIPELIAKAPKPDTKVSDGPSHPLTIENMAKLQAQLGVVPKVMGPYPVGTAPVHNSWTYMGPFWSEDNSVNPHLLTGNNLARVPDEQQIQARRSHIRHWMSLSGPAFSDHPVTIMPGGNNGDPPCKADASNQSGE